MQRLATAIAIGCLLTGPALASPGQHQGRPKASLTAESKAEWKAFRSEQKERRMQFVKSLKGELENFRVQRKQKIAGFRQEQKGRTQAFLAQHPDIRDRLRNRKAGKAGQGT